jgi:hypothetical protein
MFFIGVQHSAPAMRTRSLLIALLHGLLSPEVTAWTVTSPVGISRGDTLSVEKLAGASSQGRLGRTNQPYSRHVVAHHLSSKSEAEKFDSDWLQAELFLLNAPYEPSPDLDPETVARTICRSLQWVDYPRPTAGLARCYDFLTFECRKAVTARQGGGSVERFIEYGILSPALLPFMGAKIVNLGEASTLTPARPPTRGALISFPVQITGADVLTVQYQSGIARGGVAAAPPVTHMVVRLEQQRRPPFQHCWLVREVLDVRYAFAGDMGNAIPE